MRFSSDCLLFVQSKYIQSPTTGESIRQVKIVPAENIRPVSESLAPCDWSVVIISTLPFSLTGSRGEYLRVVGIHSDG